MILEVHSSSTVLCSYAQKEGERMNTCICANNKLKTSPKSQMDLERLAMDSWSRALKGVMLSLLNPQNTCFNPFWYNQKISESYPLYRRQLWAPFNRSNDFAASLHFSHDSISSPGLYLLLLCLIASVRGTFTSLSTVLSKCWGQSSYLSSVRCVPSYSCSVVPASTFCLFH